MTENRGPLDDYLFKHKPSAGEPEAHEVDRLWRAASSPVSPLFSLRRAGMFLAPLAAVILAVLWVGPIRNGETGEAVANATAVSEALTLPFLEEEEGLNEFDFFMASADD